MLGEDGWLILLLWLASLPMVQHTSICQDSTVFRCGLTVGKSNSLASEVSLMLDIGMHWHSDVLTFIVERI